jgi:hypothetical protein
MCLVASSVNWSDVNDLLPGRVRKTSPRKTNQSKYNQDHPKRPIHEASFGGDRLDAGVERLLSQFLVPAIRRPIRNAKGFLPARGSIRRYSFSKVRTRGARSVHS